MAADLPTLFALSSGHGRSAVAIVRLSGPCASLALTRLAGSKLPPPRRAVVRRLHDPRTGDLLDEALVLWMPGPGSFTGEDQAELHIHGGLAIKRAVLEALASIGGCRLAEPGEFTRRAFLNGRLDLTQVEGLADLIDAETEGQRRQALRLQGGGLAEAVSGWRTSLVDALASLEAALDFSDEDDVPADMAARARGGIREVADGIGAVLARAGHGERVRDGYVVVLAGEVNAGKSTLLNVIAQRDVAIVSPIPGTTRDSIEIRCDLDGLPVTFVDTAGLRDSTDPVEQEGVRRSRERAGNADLVLWLAAPESSWSETLLGTGGPPVLKVRTKVDLVREPPPVGEGIVVSALRGDGIADLLSRVRSELDPEAGARGDVIVSRQRQRGALEEALASLARALDGGHESMPELVAEDVRLALRALGRLLGQVDVEEVLDRVFSQFCIGK